MVACFCAMALIAVTVLVLQVGAATLARQRAETAADLGALAGAAAALGGAQAACDAAAAVAAANGAAVRHCATDGADVLVEVRADVAVGPLGRRAEARARAGPVARQSP